MIYKVESKKQVSEITKDLEAATQRNKFGVLGVHDLKGKMQEKGVTFERECLIFEVPRFQPRCLAGFPFTRKARERRWPPFGRRP